MAPFSPFRASTRGEELRWYREKTGREQFPLYSPWTRPTTRPGGAWVQTIVLLCRKNDDMKSLLQLEEVGARSSRAAPGRSGPFLRYLP
jgi:hypothetical protein